MLIKQIGNINSNKRNLSFGNHTICIDIGASKFNNLATMKNRLLIKNIPDIFTRTTVFNNTKQKRDADTFIEAIAKKIVRIEKRNESTINAGDPDKVLDVILDVPGPYINNKVFIPNIHSNNGEPIGFININRIPEILEQKGIKVGSFVPVNAAAGGCVLTKIKKSYPELLQEGKEILYIYPGGGLGSGSIIVDKNETKIVPRERQHVKAEFSDKSIEAAGGCATSLLNNYLEEMSKLIPAAELQKLSTNKNLSSCVVTNPKPPRYIAKYQQAHLIASKLSMDKFMDCISQLIAVEITGGKTKSAVLTGKTANGVIEGVKKNPLYYENNKALDLIKADIDKHLTPVGKVLMGDNFNVVFVPLSDSTEGSDILLKSYNVGELGSWINIPK